MELTGKIKQLGQTNTFGAKAFKKRELVITTDEQYPQHILLEFVQDKCDILDKYKEGDNVKVGINIRGREWVNPQGETKYFNSLQGWRIDKESNKLEAAAKVIDDIMPPADSQDDLPF